MNMVALANLRTEGAALLRWWIRELRDIAHALLERAAPRLAKHVVIEFKGETAEAYVLRRGSSSDRVPIARDQSGAWPGRLPAGDALVDHHGARATLVLAPEDTFGFDFFVPQALRRELDKVISLHLEGALPLARDQFAVDYQIREYPSSTGKVRVQVLVAHRSHLDHLRNLAQQWQLRPTRIGALGETGAVLGDFLRSPFRFRTIRLTPLERRLTAAVFGLAIMLAALIASQWIYERIVVNSQLRHINAQAQVASHLAHRLMRESAPTRDLVHIARVPDASDVLATLTRTIPSDAWVYELRVQAPSTGALVIRMGAFAPPATTLVSALENAHRFGTVELISETSAGGPSGLDRLKLTASRTADEPSTSDLDETPDTGATP